MDPTRVIMEVIDLRSFSNLWFWIALAVLWSTASHWVIGVPWDLVTRAKRRGGQHQEDVEALTRIYVNRLLHIGRVSGTWAAALVAAALAAFWVLGFHYGIHFFQALFLMGFPLTLVGLLSINTAAKIEAGDNSGAALYRRLRKHRILVQVIGVISILITAFWGMYQNLIASVLGN